MAKETKNVIFILLISLILTAIIFPLAMSILAKHENITPSFCQYPNYCDDVPTSLNQVGWPFIYGQKACCGVIGEIANFDRSVQVIDFMILFFMIFVPIFVIYYIITFLNLRKYANDKKTK